MKRVREQAKHTGYGRRSEQRGGTSRYRIRENREGNEEKWGEGEERRNYDNKLKRKK